MAGQQLFAAHWKRKKANASGLTFASGFVHASVQDAGAFAEYFEREVLSRLAPDEAELLVRAASCERFTASLCEALGEQAMGEGEILALLTRLEQENLFITPAQGPEREAWYRLHPLLRETLAQRFRSRSESQQRAVHAAAWRWFHDHRMLEEAVRHAVLAGDADTAADLVQRFADTLMMRGEVRKALGLLRVIPADQVQARPELRLLALRTQMFSRDLDQCAAAADRLEADIPPGDSSLRYRLALLRFSLAVLRDDTQSALALLPQIEAAPADLTALFIGSRNNLLSWLYMHLGDYERARRIQTEAPPLVIDGAPLLGTASGMLNGRCMIGFSHALEGNVIQAERVARDVLREVEQAGHGAAGAGAEPEYLPRRCSAKCCTNRTTWTLRAACWKTGSTCSNGYRSPIRCCGCTPCWRPRTGSAATGLMPSPSWSGWRTTARSCTWTVWSRRAWPTSSGCTWPAATLPPPRPCWPAWTPSPHAIATRRAVRWTRSTW